MSRCCRGYYGGNYGGYGGYGSQGCGYGCCNFPQLIILILILLQFSCKKGLLGNNCDNNSLVGGIDKGIIFIITLYYLCCCSPCGKRY